MRKIFNPQHKILKSLSALAIVLTAACGQVEPSADEQPTENVVPDGMLTSAPDVKVTACGDMPMSGALPGMSADEASILTLNGVVRGAVSEGSHFYEVELQRGAYHFVSDGDAIVRIESEKEGVMEERSDLLFASESRMSRYLEVSEDTRVAVSVISGSYAMGFFANGTAVPSPQFTECPEMTGLVMDMPTGQEAVVEPRETDYRWFNVDFEEGPYVLELRTSDESIRDIDVMLLDGFGDRQEFLFVDDNTESMPIMFDIETAGSKWILLSFANGDFEEVKSYEVELMLVRP